MEWQPRIMKRTNFQIKDYWNVFLKLLKTEALSATFLLLELLKQERSGLILPSLTILSSEERGNIPQNFGF